MRKSALLLVLLFLCALPALAETPAVDEALVGEWTTALCTWYYDDSQIYQLWPGFDGDCVIAEDGRVRGAYLGQTPLPLLYDNAAGLWYIQDDSFGSMYLYTDQYGQLIMRGQVDTLVLLRADAAPAELPPTENCLAYGGTWELTSLYFSAYEGLPSFMVEPASLGLPALTVTLGDAPDDNAFSEAVCGAITQQAPGTLLDTGRYSCELRNSDTLLIHSSSFTLVMTRTMAPEVDEALLPYVQQLDGQWRLNGVTVGGIPVSPEALFDAEDVTLAIDEAGYARLGDRITALTPADGALLLDGMPLTIEGGGLTLEAAEGVMLHFVTEADWCRAQLDGDWRLDRITIPGLDVATSSGDDGVSGRLVIGADGTVTLQHDGGAIRFTLQSTDSVTEYILLGEDGDVRTLSVLSVNSLRISITGGSGAYTCYFVPAE